MAYVVYVMECADGSLYTGITTDLARRLKEHQGRKGGAYTSAHSVKSVVYKEDLPSRSAALKREAEIKKLSRTKKLALINKATNVILHP